MSTNLFNPADKRSYPVRWPLIRGKQLFQEIDERSKDGTEELLSVSHITGITPRSQKNVTMFQAESLVGYKLCKTGDIAANTMWTWQGAIGVSKFAGVVSPAYNVYRQKSDIFNPRYLDMLLRERQLVDVYHSLSTGIRPSRLRLYPDVFLTIKLPVPPREEQDQIVRFLDWKISNINKLINIKQEQLKKVKELLDRLFRDTMSKCSKNVKIKYLFELDDDFFVPDASESYAKAGMYNRGRGIFLREPCLGNELGDSQFQHIHSDCLMLSGQFAWEDAVYITQEKDTHGIASHRYYLLKPVRYVPVEYLWVYFLSCEGFFNLQQCSHGSAGRNRPLNIKEVLNLELPVPDDKEKANALNELVRDYMRLQVITEEEKKALLDFRTHLVADVVTGKIDVRGIEIPEYEFVDEDTNADNEDDDEEETEEQEN